MDVPLYLKKAGIDWGVWGSPGPPAEPSLKVWVGVEN